MQRLCVGSKGEGGAVSCCIPYFSFPLSFLSAKYSTKEDKYEEEIKLLTDKLKEVRRDTASPGGGGTPYVRSGERMEDLALKGLQGVLSARPLAGRQAGRHRLLTCHPTVPQQQPRKEEAQ